MQRVCYCGEVATHDTPFGVYCAKHAWRHWFRRQPLIYLDNIGWRLTDIIYGILKDLQQTTLRGFEVVAYKPVRFPNQDEGGDFTRRCRETVQELFSFPRLVSTHTPVIVVNSPAWNTCSAFWDDYTRQDATPLCFRPAVWVYLRRDMVNGERFAEETIKEAHKVKPITYVNYKTPNKSYLVNNPTKTAFALINSAMRLWNMQKRKRGENTDADVTA